MRCEGTHGVVYAARPTNETELNPHREQCGRMFLDLNEATQGRIVLHTYCDGDAHEMVPVCVQYSVLDPIKNIGLRRRLRVANQRALRCTRSAVATP